MALDGRYTAFSPNIFGFSPIAPILIIADLFIKEWFILIIAVAFFVFEGIAKLAGMSIGMMSRYLTRGVFSVFFGRGIHSTPLAWKRNHVVVASGLAIMLSLTPHHAEAVLTVTDSMAYDRTWQTGMIGQRSDDVIEAMCDGCPLKLGLESIIPADFDVFISGSLKPMKISFTGSRPWGQILHEMAENNDLDIEVMRHGHRVIVSKSAKNRGRVVVTTLNAKSKGFYQTKSWELIPGDTLRQSLTRWASVEGWHVLYLLENDITIDVTAVFEGNLLEAMKLVLESYKGVGILSRVSMDYSHLNNTVRISLGSGTK